MADLSGHVDYSNLECLNQNPKHPIANALKQGYREDGGLFLESDCDEQILINIPFQQKVRTLCLCSKRWQGLAPSAMLMMPSSMLPLMHCHRSRSVQSRSVGHQMLGPR